MSAEPLAEHGTDGKDAALSEDIRLLGRLLGDVVRDQAGDEVFALVEGVRQRAVGDRRDGRSPARRAGRRPARAIDRRPAAPHPRLRVAVVAGQHGRGRPPRAAAAVPPRARVAAPGRQPRRVARPAPRRRRRRRRRSARMVDDALVVPVITAHPTEVRRRTVLDVLGEVARLLSARTALPAGSPERAGLEDRLGMCVLTLWQTAVLRLSRLARERRDQRGVALLRRRAVRGRAGARARARGGRGRALGRRGRRHPRRAHGVVDRRRPRRQPVRHRRRRPHGDERACPHGLRPPPRRGVAPVAVAVDVVPPRDADGRPARPRRGLRRRFAVPGRRAVPPRPQRHVRPPPRPRRRRCSSPTSPSMRRRPSCRARRTGRSTRWSPTSRWSPRRCVPMEPAPSPRRPSSRSGAPS